jgi:hypothetical protein
MCRNASLKEMTPTDIRGATTYVKIHAACKVCDAVLRKYNCRIDHTGHGFPIPLVGSNKPSLAPTGAGVFPP